MSKKHIETFKETIFNVAQNKKFQIGLTIVLFLIILFTSTQIRLSNIPNLVDKTTGEYLFADPDAYYMYRVAETYLARDGDLSGIDSMRNPGLNITYNKEILSPILVFSYKIFKPFNEDLTLRTVDVYYPAIAFFFSLIIFFFLVLYVSKSKFAALLASALLAYFPAYLGRTTAGISSHESLGMVFLFLTLLTFVYSLSNFQKSWEKTITLGILTGITFALSFLSWGGGANFALMTFPIATLLYFLFNIQDKDLDKKLKLVVFNLIWLIACLIVPLFFSYSFDSLFSRFFSSYGILIPFTFALMVVDFCLEKYSEKIKFGQSKYRLIYSVILTIFLGFIGLFLIGKNPFSLLYAVYYQLLYPFGTGRVGLTVAYYAQPYITDLIAQYSKPLFWLAFLGMGFIGLNIAKNIKDTKLKIYLNFAWVLALIGMTLSRYSSTSTFNGTNLISQLVYFGSIIIFAACLFYAYFKERFEIDTITLFLFAWMFVMILSMRSAVRVIFVILTFVVIAVAIFIKNSYDKAKNSKDQTAKYFFYTLSIIAIILCFVLLFGNPISKSPGMYQITKYSAASTGPIANDQWQEAMGWARNNTQPDNIFIHWWDYGYLVQTLANRTTVLDGGNANAYWNHMFGRYVLTTPNPLTALSFLKSHEVSYLLIDPTDFGKYAAYAKIGSNDNWDRFSSPNVMISDPSQNKETAKGVTRLYQGTTFVDEDISYDKYFLPGPTYDKIGNPSYKAYVIGVIMNVSAANSSGYSQLNQPSVAFYYNNQQIILPIRYLYYNGQKTDFGTGIESTFMVIPSVSQASNGQIKIDNAGAGVYLSRRNTNSLYAQIYLMNNTDEYYNYFKLVEKEDDYVVKLLKTQGLDLGEFVYFQGLRAPLKIWKVDYPSNIVTHQEFKAIDGGYGSLDNFTFAN